MDVALGLKARTGRAVLIAVGGTPREPHFVERSELRLLPEGAFAPYHAAEELEPAAARESVRRSIAAANRLATTGIRAAASRLASAGHAVRGCGVLVGTGMPDWSTEEILAVHVRMHKAEGELFRDVLAAGVRACGLPLTTLPDKSALPAAAELLGAAPADLAARLAALGKSAGPPWGKDQKEAAAAALVALRASGTTQENP
jgi:hypothetical protein